jgi:hypothetical protein
MGQDQTHAGDFGHIEVVHDALPEACLSRNESGRPWHSPWIFFVATKLQDLFVSNFTS